MSPRRVLAFLAVVLGLWAFTSLLGAQQPAQPEKPQEPVQPEKKAGESKEARKQALKEVIAKAQEEYRIFFKEPKTVLEYWAALTFEMEVGKFDVSLSRRPML